MTTVVPYFASMVRWSMYRTPPPWAALPIASSHVSCHCMYEWETTQPLHSIHLFNVSTQLRHSIHLFLRTYAKATHRIMLQPRHCRIMLQPRHSRIMLQPRHSRIMLKPSHTRIMLQPSHCSINWSECLGPMSRCIRIGHTFV